MQITEQEYQEFLDIHPPLLLYTGIKGDLLPVSTTLDEFYDLLLEDKLSLRNFLYDHMEILDDFLKENPYQFTKDQLAIIDQFRHFIRGRFVILKYLTNYTIFLSEDKVAYGVCSLFDPFEAFFGDTLPVLANTVLIPFKGKVIYDGFMEHYNLYFGSGMTSDMTLDYNEAKAKYGIVTSLPFDPEKVDQAFGDEEELRLYMKTAKSREIHWNDIEDLLENNPKLWPVYHYEWGRINARSQKKSLKELGIKKRHFAICKDVILASGSTKQEVEQQVELMLSAEDQKGVYYFKV